MEYVETKVREKTDNTLVRCLISCCKCCLKCFTNIAGYVNKALLTVSQIYNTNFCESGSKVFDILSAEMATALLLNGICRFIIFLSKMVVAGACGLIAVLWLQSRDRDVDWGLPFAVVFFVSFLLCGLILNMYDMVVEITFVCYMSDKAMTANGSSRREYTDAETKAMFEELEKPGNHLVEGN
jgi:hypothetical protein